LDETELVDTEWAAHRRINHITARGRPADAKSPASYEQIYWQFIETNYPGSFRSFKFFKALASFRSSLRTRGMLRPFRDEMGRFVDFLNSSIDNNAVLSMFHHMSVVICSRAAQTSGPGPDKSFLNTLTKDELNAALLISFEFAVLPKYCLIDLQLKRHTGRTQGSTHHFL
jgi:hypothetical protein